MLATLALSLGILFAQATPPEHELLPAELVAPEHHGLVVNDSREANVEEAGERAASPAEHIFHHVRDQPDWISIPIPAALQLHLFGKTVDPNLDIGKHTVSMWIASLLLLLVFALAVRKKALVPRGLYSMLESFVVFIRDDIAIQNIGHDGARYTPYLCSAFFFILFMSFLGLFPIPGIGTATGNLSVTLVLAAFTFVLTQLTGMRTQGAAGYWLHLIPSGVPKWLYPLMIPVEILGLFTKPFALTVRLFANMLAGHIVIYFLLALTVLLAGGIEAHALGIAVLAVPFALAIYMLEIFVALVQAYVFTMLSAVFIGLAAHGH